MRSDSTKTASAPPVLEFYVNLGHPWISEKRPDRAVAPLQKAIELGTACVPAHVESGRRRMMVGNDAEGMAAFRKAVNLEPDNPETLTRFAAFLGQLGRDGRGGGDYRRLLAAGPAWRSSPNSAIA